MVEGDERSDKDEERKQMGDKEQTQLQKERTHLARKGLTRGRGHKGLDRGAGSGGKRKEKEAGTEESDGKRRGVERDLNWKQESRRLPEDQQRRYLEQRLGGRAMEEGERKGERHGRDEEQGVDFQQREEEERGEEDQEGNADDEFYADMESVFSWSDMGEALEPSQGHQAAEVRREKETRNEGLEVTCDGVTYVIVPADGATYDQEIRRIAEGTVTVETAAGQARFNLEIKAIEQFKDLTPGGDWGGYYALAQAQAMNKGATRDEAATMADPRDKAFRDGVVEVLKSITSKNSEDRYVIKEIIALIRMGRDGMFELEEGYHYNVEMDLDYTLQKTGVGPVVWLEKKDSRFRIIKVAGTKKTRGFTLGEIADLINSAKIGKEGDAWFICAGPGVVQGGLRAIVEQHFREEANRQLKPWRRYKDKHNM
jgi:hypothetical protein